jgi:UDP-GlcNAc3NAcA epimerase
MSYKILSVVGARPQFIKAATVSRAIRKAGDMVEIMAHTGQHYDSNMSDIFFNELGIPAPKYHLGVGSGGHGEQTGKMLDGIEKVLLDEKPDCVLVYGDTNSTLAGALAAAKLHIPVAHVEAGLRSFNKKMPEEINRIVADHCSAMLFATTDTAVHNLRTEGFPESVIFQVGDPMYDAALYYAEQADKTTDILARLSLDKRGYVLSTVHRPENTDDPTRIRSVFNGLAEIAKELPVILPLHPRTRHALEREGLMAKVESELTILPPIGYVEMVALEKNAKLIATDSGGVQKEAFFYQTPSIILRDQTEWVELLALGWSLLITPTSQERVVEGVRLGFQLAGETAQPYGDGAASDHIVSIMRSHFEARKA